MNSAIYKRSAWVIALAVTATATQIDRAQVSASTASVRLVDAGGSDGGDCTAAACATINYAIGVSAPGDTVSVAAGTYNEDVNVSQSVTLQGAGIGATTVVGPIGGAGSTIVVAASNVVIDGLTITRAGNTVADWNNAGLNTAGISIQGQAITGVEIRNSELTGLRTAIDINNSSGHFIHNNIITNNRTGMVLRNQTDNLTVAENIITNNWTLGIVFLDASGGTNVPAQTALNSTFSNNDISGNWYGQIVERQTGGSLPAPGTTNLKYFRGNWLGTSAPIVTTANSAEPGYAGQIPVAFGGTAGPPALSEPHIAGTASANVLYRPTATSGTDTNVETVPGRGTIGFQGALITNTVDDSDVSRQSENSFPLAPWVLYRRTLDESGTFLIGPNTPPAGVGSLELVTTGPADKITLFNYDQIGTRLSTIDMISYATYRNAGAAFQAPSLNIQVNPNGPNNGTFTTLVYEPVYNTDQGDVVDGVWQLWNAYNNGAGLWWSTRDLRDASNVLIACNPNGALAGDPSCANKFYVPWSTIVAGLPNAFISGGFGINLGSGGQALNSSVDALTIGGYNYAVMYDFDHQLAQTIDFSPLPNRTFGDAPFQVAATASSNLPVSFAAGGDCSVSGDVVTITGAGNCTITASQEGDALYDPAPEVARSFAIAKATATLTLSNLAQSFNGSPRNVTVTTTPAGLSGVTVTYDGSTTAPSAVGSYDVIASLLHDDYEAVNATGELVIIDNRTSQAINTGNISNKNTLSANFTVGATATSGLEVTFSAAGPCTVSPVGFQSNQWRATVDVTGAGSCTITFLQAGDDDWAPASATRTFTITKVNQTINFGSLPNRFVTESPFTVNATVSSGLPLTFTSNTPAVCTLSAPTATSALVTLHTTGSCSITASRAADDTYNAATSVTRSFNVTPSVTLTSVTASPSSFIGGCAVPNGKVTLSANTPVDRVVNLSSNNPNVIVPASVTVLAGQKTAVFAIATNAVANQVTAVVSATMGSTTVTRNLTVKVNGVLSVSLAPATVTGGSPSTATVTLSCVAQSDVTVSLTATNAARAALVSQSIIIPAGSQSGVAGITTTAGPLTTSTIKATANGVSKQATLTIQP
jgi:hypothetical protein